MDGRRSRDIEATVDTGAAYTTLPTRLLRELGVAPMGKRRFLLADGRRIEMDYGEARATVDGENVTTLVVEDDGPLGAIPWKDLRPWPGRGLVPTHLIMH